MSAVRSGQDVADEIEAPFRNAYSRFNRAMDRVPYRASGPNDTVRELNRRSADDAREEVARSFQPKKSKRVVKRSARRK